MDKDMQEALLAGAEKVETVTPGPEVRTEICILLLLKKGPLVFVKGLKIYIFGKLGPHMANFFCHLNLLPIDGY